MDDFRRPQRPTNNSYAQPTRPTSQSPTTQSQTQPLASNQAYPEQTYSNEHIQNSSDLNLHHDQPKSRKGLVFALVLFIILFILSTAAAAWLYLGQKENQKKIDELNLEVSRLTQKVQALDYDNYDLSNKLKIATDKNAELQKTAQELKDTCGSDCSDIVIPE